MDLCSGLNMSSSKYELLSANLVVDQDHGFLSILNFEGFKITVYGALMYRIKILVDC